MAGDPAAYLAFEELVAEEAPMEGKGDKDQPRATVRLASEESSAIVTRRGSVSL